ncbi:leukotoxin LktA family filamentous adhesin [Falsigemmobacter intermedius]|uniref:Leukotoxin LktA family filamentous adhesin n=1 Tax=Falsigemmobacter intermedius TaxID=1553448 RepID=A0A444MAD0_9RHOB|nr:leukotoxin LktA family filamentous adhesin [Falsigemmobacter intermedius]RWY40399.1 leukotoxin LktA family filamentous adhesin [Falsigemmobacter intermedius]
MTNALQDRPVLVSGLRATLRRGVSALAIASVISGQIAPAWADAASVITGTGAYDAGISTSTAGGQSVFDITGQKAGSPGSSTDVMVYDTFNLATGDSVNFRLNQNSSRIVNIMEGNAGVAIDGAVRSFEYGATSVGGDIYFVTPGGFVLGENGSVQAGRLVVTTPTAGYRDDMIDSLGSGPHLKSFEGYVDDIDAGNEEMGNGAIEIRGRIEARALSLRAGARMLLNGQVTVSGAGGTDSGQPVTAVNTGDVKRAAGVVVRDGVVSLRAAGDLTIGGNITATNGATGGAAITAQAKDITLKLDQPNSALVAGADGASRPGFIIMFAEDSLLAERAVKLEAMGAGGLVWLGADEITLGQGGSGTGDGTLGGSAGGTVMLEGGELKILGGFTTGGAQVLAEAGRIDIDGSLTTSGGDVIAKGRDIRMNGGTIDTTAPGGSGLIALVAEHSNIDQAWPISVRDAEAKVTLAGATLKGGAIVVYAVARSGTGTNLDDAAALLESEERLARLQDAFFNSFGSQTVIIPADGDTPEQEVTTSALSDILEGLIDAGVDAAQNASFSALKALAAQLVVSIPINEAKASVTITDSTITSDGTRGAAGLTRQNGKTNWAEGERARDAAITNDGLVSDVWSLSAPAILGTKRLTLPADWNGPNAETPASQVGAPREDVYIRAHAETMVETKPGALLPVPVSALGAYSKTRATVQITGATEITSARDLALRSTVRDAMAVDFKGAKIGGLTLALNVTVQEVENQLLVDAKKISAGGRAIFEAKTVRSHETSVAAAAGDSDWLAVALNVGLSSNHTEAAVNVRPGTSGDRSTGGLHAGGGVDLTAQTLYLANSRVTEATVSENNPTTAVVTKNPHIEPLISGMTKAIKRNLGMDANSQPKTLGLGFGIDVNAFQDDTFASLNGGYHDLENGGDYRAFATPGAVTLSGVQDLNLRSSLDYRTTTALSGPVRRAVSRMGDFGFVLKRKADLLGLSYDQLIGQHTDGIFAAGALSYLGSRTEAELGGNVKGGTVSVSATTDLGSLTEALSGLWDSVQEWRDYAGRLETLKGLPAQVLSDAPEDQDSDAPGQASAVLDTQPEMPDLMDYLLSGLTPTSGVISAGTRTPKPTSNPGIPVDDKAQNSAMGLSLNAFMTNAQTAARILDGAVIATEGDVSVHAAETSAMIFGNNFLPTHNPFASDGPATALGGTLGAEVNRGSISTTVGRAQIEARDLNVTALNDRFMGQLVYAGRGGREKGISLSLGANVTLKDTTALVSGNARIDLDRDLKIEAKDDTINLAVAAGLSGATAAGSGTPATAVGGAVIVNYMERDVYAGIGYRKGEVADGTGYVTAAGAASIAALNNALDIGVAAAGAVTAETAAPPQTPGSGGGAKDDSILMSLNPLVGDDVVEKMMLLEDIDFFDDLNTDETSEVGSQKTGLSLAGSGVANIIASNSTRSEIAAGSKLTSGGNLQVSALNNGLTIGASGAVSVALQTQNGADVLAGALSITLGFRDVSAKLGGEILSENGTITVQAKDESHTVNVAVGGAGTSKGDKAIAGSVAMNLLMGETLVDVNGARLEAGQKIDLLAADSSWQLAVGGAIAVNMSADQGLGFGIGVASNNYNRHALVRLRNAAQLTAADIAVEAGFNARLYGFGISAGAGKTGAAGSASVNTIVADARVEIGDSPAAQTRVALKALNSLKITARDEAQIWALAGALAFGRQNAVGAAGAVNVITGKTLVKIDNALLEGRIPAATAEVPDPYAAASVELLARGNSKIRSLGVAGAAGLDGTAVGAGITVNTVVADAGIAMTGSVVRGAESFTADAKSKRDIQSIAGAAAAGGKGAAGAALAVNLILSNDTTTVINGNDITASAVTAKAVAEGKIRSASVAIGASTGSAVAGSVSVNVITGNTRADIRGGTIRDAQSVAQIAEDDQTIKVIAGNAAVGTGGAGVGVAIAANVIAQGTFAKGSYALTGAGAPDLSASAVNRAHIAAIGATVAGGSTTGVGVSAAVGDIGNRTEATLDTDAVSAGDITVNASNNSQIDILGGAAGVGMGGAGVGAAVSLAMIHDTTYAGLDASRLTSSGDLSVTAYKEGNIKAAAIGIAAGSGAGVGASVVFTMIGRESTVDGLAEAHSFDPDAPEGQASTTTSARGDADATKSMIMADLASNAGAAGDGRLDQALGSANGRIADDVTEAKLRLQQAGEFGNILVRAEDKATISSLAGSAAAGGAAGVGAGLTVNLMFGATKSGLELASGRSLAGSVSVLALQTGRINTHAYAFGGGGSAGVAGALNVNVMQRGLLTEVKGNGATLATNAADVTAAADQTGVVDSIAGVLAFGGAAGVSAAISVSYVNDSAATAVRDVAFDTRETGIADLTRAGKVTLRAGSDLEVMGSAASAGVAAGAGISGAVVVNVGAGEVSNTSRNTTIHARDLDILTLGDRNFTAYSGVLAGGFAGIGLATSVNTAGVKVTSRHDGLTAKLGGHGRLESSAEAGFGGLAVGLSGGAVAVVGTAIANTSKSEVVTELTAADVVARGNLDVSSDLKAFITIDGGDDSRVGAVTGGAAVGGLSGAGAAVAVNVFKGKAETRIGDQSRLAALGDDGRLAVEAARGLRIRADSAASVSSATIMAASGIGAATGAISTVVLQDAARVLIGDLNQDGLTSGRVVLNEQADPQLRNDLGYDQGSTTRGHAAQDSVIAATSNAEIAANVGSVAAGLGAGGAAISVVVAENEAKVRLGGAVIGANRDVEISALSDTRIGGSTAGAAAGVGAGASTVSTRFFASRASVDLLGTDVLPRPTETPGTPVGDLRITAQTRAENTAKTGAFSAAAVGGSGAVSVTQSDSSAVIRVDSIRGLIATEEMDGTEEAVLNSNLHAAVNTTLLADNLLEIAADTMGGSGGVFGGTSVVSQTLIAGSEAAVRIGADQSLEAGGDLSIRAKDRLESHTRTGAISAAGLAATGIAVDVQRFETTSEVSIGRGASLIAGGDVVLSAQSSRDIDVGVSAGSAAGISGISAAVSTIDIGGTLTPTEDKERRAKAAAVAETRAALAAAGDDNASGLAGGAGAKDAQSAGLARSAGLNLDGSLGADSARVVIGDGAQISGRDVSLGATSLTDVTQNTGVLGVGGIAGAASGTGLIHAGAGAQVTVGDDSTLAATRRLTLSAHEGQAAGGISATAHTVAGAGIAALGVGVARVEVTGSAGVTVGANSHLSGGHNSDAGEGVSLSALRDLAATLEVANHASGGFVGIGAAVAHVSDRGLVRIRIGESGAEGSLSGGQIRVTARNAARQSVTAEAGAGGAYLGASGVDARAIAASVTETSALGVTISGDEVSLITKATPDVSAEAKGKALGAVATGVSLARAELSAKVTADFEGAIRAGSILIETALRGEGASATASSSAGGVGAGGGADATAKGGYLVAATLRGDMVASGGDLSINTLAEGLRFKAIGDGKAGGVVAAGAVTAFAGQQAGEQAEVSLTLDGLKTGDLLLARDGLRINTLNAPGYTTRVSAGSQGVFAGSAAAAETQSRISTSALIGTLGGAFTLSGRDFSLVTASRPDLLAYVSSTTANLAGASGARQTTGVSIAQSLRLGAGTTVTAQRSADLASVSRITRGALNGEATIYGGSGGLAGGAAVRSTVTTSVDNQFTVENGATVEMGAAAGLEGVLSLAALNEYDILDRAELHADGGIAIPKAEIEITSSRSDAILSIQDAELYSNAGLRLSAGNQVKILAYANVSTTGLAGAASGSTRADFTGNAKVQLASGARLFAAQDVELLAGYARGQLQTFDLQAETRLYNKTAAPIKTDPDADAIARDTSLVEIAAGADVKAVRDIVVAAEGGDRTVRGFGRGTDLYRQVMAEIASAVSGVFGGDPVSLDILSGTSDDRGNHGLRLNGNLRAGARNIQVLYFDAQNNAHYGQYANDLLAHAQTTWDTGTGTAATKALSERLAEVDGWLSAPAFASNEIARAAWTMERARLIAAIDEIRGDANRVQITVGDIRASAGNIHLRGTHVAGNGRLVAPGDALIEIKATPGSTATLAVGNLTIDNYEGGTISFNGTRLRDNAMLAGLSQGGTAPNLTLVSAETDPAKPVIRVEAGSAEGRLLHQGDVFNLGGEVWSSGRDVSIYREMRAADVNIAGARSVSMEYRPGVRSTGGANPEDTHAAYFTSVEAAIRARVRALNQGSSVTYRTGSLLIPSFRPSSASETGGIFANSSIFISADMVNVNSTIRAGVGAYDITLGAGLDQVLQSLSGSTDILLYDPVTGGGLSSAMAHISSNAAISWDPLAKRIKVADIVALGGDVTIVGDIFSTGNGRIEVLDGFSALNVDSRSAYTLELGRVMIGGELDSDGVAKGATGKISLWDYDYSRPAGNQLVLREFTREAGDARQYTYATKANRDYIFTSVTETKTVVTKRREELILVGGVVDRDNTITKITNETAPSVNVIAQAPYLSGSLSGADYAYAVEGTLLSRSATEKSAEKKTHDSVRWWKGGSGYRHYTWTETHTTVEQFEHRVKADYAIDIRFSGSDAMAGAQTIAINAAGSVIFGGIVNNYGGTAQVRSDAGSITAGNRNVVLSGQAMDFSAAAGSIGSAGQALNLALVAGQAVTARAADGIHLASARGDLLVGDITTSRSDALVSSVGAVSLSARGNLIQQAGTTIRGGDITVSSATGGIGGTESLRIDLQGAGRLSATASGDIDITETDGDLRVARVVSQAGDVTLRAPTGAITDGLDDARSDFRTNAELAQIWRDELGLTVSGERTDAMIAAYEAERERMYRDYWDARDKAGALPGDFTPTEETVLGWDQQRADLRARGLSTDALEAEIAAWTAERQAFWRSLDGETARQTGYTYTAGAAEREAITTAALFDQDQMLRSISAAVVRRNTSTQDSNESSNVTAFGSISLLARDGVGQDLDDVVIDVTQTISNEDLLLLSRALAHNVTFDKEAGTIRLRRFDDLNVAMTGGRDALSGLGSGVLTVSSQTAGRSVFIGADHGLRLGTITSAGGVTLRAGGAITGSRTSGTDITAAGDLVLESAEADIGTQERRLSVEVTNNGRANLRAKGDIRLAAQGALTLAEVYSQATADLFATGAITDAFATATPRIVARNILLSGSSIGTLSQALGLELERDGTGALGTLSLAATAADLRVALYEDARIASATAAGDLSVLAHADLSLAGAMATPGRMDLTVTGDLSVEAADPAGHLSLRDLTLSAASVGATGAPLGIRQTGQGGLVSLTTTAGTARAELLSSTRLSLLSLATGGEILAAADLALVGADVIRFGAQDLSLDLRGALDLSAATGVDISGSRLRLTAAGDVGRGAQRLETALDVLTAQVGGELHVTDAGDLLTEALSAGRVLDLLVLNDLTLGGAMRASQVVMTANRHLNIGAAPVTAEELQLFALSGTIAGLAGSSAQITTPSLGSLTAYAAGAVDLTGTAGLNIRYAIAGTDLRLRAAAGDLTASALQGRNLTHLTASGDVAVTAIGTGHVTGADQSGFGLAALPAYGRQDLQSVGLLDVTAGGAVTLGLARAGTVQMTSDRIDAVLTAAQPNGHIDATVRDNGDTLGPVTRIETVAGQDIGDPNAADLAGLRQGLDRNLRDQSSIFFDGPVSQDAVLVHRGNQVQFAEQDAQLDQRVIRGDEHLRLSRVFAGIDGSVQLELWLGPQARVNVDLGEGSVLAADPVLALETRRAGFVLNGREVLSEETARGLTERLSLLATGGSFLPQWSAGESDVSGPDAQGQPLLQFRLAPGWQSFRRGLDRAPLILGSVKGADQG